MNIKTFFKNISPFNNRRDMPAALYIIKKMLAFFFIYGAAMVAGEGIIIGLLCAMGYNPLMGDMPGGHFPELSEYYGFAIFFAVAVLYARIFEKRGLRSLGFGRRGFDYLTGGAIAIVLLAVIVGVCCAAGVMDFTGMETNVDWVYLIALFGAFAIQSLAEETICRSFLQGSLTKKVSLPVAILVCSTAFAIPHLPTVLECESAFATVGVINLYLVSIVFSILYVLRDNSYIVSGLHCVWNYVLNGIMGLPVSGSGAGDGGILRYEVTNNLLTGGEYGLEASAITTVVLGIAAAILVIIYFKNKRGMKYELQQSAV